MTGHWKCSNHYFGG